MKTLKMIAAMFVITLCIIATSSYAQTKTNSATMKDCCMMKDGKMMLMKAGKTLPMEKAMTMKNGTKCMTNGECVMKDGKKMQMKEGECMDMSGKMGNCDMMNKGAKISTEKKNVKHVAAVTYVCPMHPEEISNKPGKCTKCGMDLVKK